MTTTTTTYYYASMATTSSSLRHRVVIYPDGALGVYLSNLYYEYKL